MSHQIGTPKSGGEYNPRHQICWWNWSQKIHSGRWSLKSILLRCWNHFWRSLRMRCWWIDDVFQQNQASRENAPAMVENFKLANPGAGEHGPRSWWLHIVEIQTWAKGWMLPKQYDLWLDAVDFSLKFDEAPEDVSDPAPGRSTVCECSDTSAKPCSSSSCSKSRSVHGSASLHALGDSDWISKTTKNWSLFHLHSAGQRITSHNGTMIAVSRWWVQCNANKILQWCWIWHSDFRTQTFFHQVDLNGPMVRRHSTSLVS